MKKSLTLFALTSITLLNADTPDVFTSQGKQEDTNPTQETPQQEKHQKRIIIRKEDGTYVIIASEDIENGSHYKCNTTKTDLFAPGLLLIAAAVQALYNIGSSGKTNGNSNNLVGSNVLPLSIAAVGAIRSYFNYQSTGNPIQNIQQTKHVYFLNNPDLTTIVKPDKNTKVYVFSPAYTRDSQDSNGIKLRATSESTTKEAEAFIQKKRSAEADNLNQMFGNLLNH